MALSLDLRKQFMDVVETSACFQPQFVRASVIGPTLCGLPNGVKTGANRFIHYSSERSANRRGYRPHTVQDIVVYCQCCSHRLAS